MTKLVYRGVAYEAEHNKDQAEARVYRRPEMFYRGVAHNGVRTIEANKPTGFTAKLIYRGHQLA